MKETNVLVPSNVEGRSDFSSLAPHGAVSKAWTKSPKKL
jgi:hypothetical protein